jgi:acyl-CoA reductase-like NAD-dependent aldehyde dehydrogenase
MSFYDLLAPAEFVAVDRHMDVVRFAPGACILEEGTSGDECYLISDGRVRLEVHSTELDSDAVLDYLEAGQVLGEFSLFDQRARSASAFADTAVTARRLTRAAFDELCAVEPRLGVTLLKHMAQDFTFKLRHMDDKLKSFIWQGKAPAWVDDMVARGAAAQAKFADWPEERVDALIEEIAAEVLAAAASLAADAVRETGLGVVEHKTQKITLAARLMRDALVGRPARGALPTDEPRHVTEILCPLGVVLGLIPLTNPVSTMLFKTLICLKSRNALIASCHRKALGVGGRLGDLIHAVMKRHGADEDLVQWIRERGSRATTAAFMTHPGVALILATGGPSMVHAAYSSGTPAIGVGAGNAPVWVCPDADLEATARCVIASKSFDNGVICGSDNNLVVDQSVVEPFVAALQANGAALLCESEIATFTARVTDDKGHVRPELIGKSAQHLLAHAGIVRLEAAQLIVVPLAREQLDGPWGREKLAPIISLLTVDGEADGLAVCERILTNMGAGHTAIIHTQDHSLALRYAESMPASRVLVNCGGATGCIGVGNGLAHSWTLGCGSWGGTSTTDNVTYRNLLNVKRLAEAI